MIAQIAPAIEYSAMGLAFLFAGFLMAFNRKCYKDSRDDRKEFMDAMEGYRLVISNELKHSESRDEKIIALLEHLCRLIEIKLQ